MVCQVRLCASRPERGTHCLPGAREPDDVLSVAAADGVEVVGNQAAAYLECFSPRGFLASLLLDLDRALVGLPIAGDSVEDLMGAFAAGAESVGAGHFLVLNGQGYTFKLA
jgi:hypothetical protein